MSEAVIDKNSRPPRRHLVSTRLLGPSARVYRRLIATKTVVQYWVYYSAKRSHMSPAEAFATTIRFLIGKKHVLDRLISRVQWSHCSLTLTWSLILILAVRRAPSSLDRPPQKGFDHLIQFWSRSQTLLHGTYRYKFALRAKQLSLVPRPRAPPGENLHRLAQATPFFH